MAGRRGGVVPSAKLSFVALLCCLAFCSAAPEFYIAEQMVDSSDVSSLNSGTLLVDLRPPPVPPNPKAWTLGTEKDALQRRGLKVEDDNKDESTSSPLSAQQTSMASSESTAAAVAHHTTASSTMKSSSLTSSSAASLATQSSQPSSSPLPTPFDQGFAGNITETCSNFVYGFIADSTFTSCLPFSLLLQVCLHLSYRNNDLTSIRIPSPSSKPKNPFSQSPRPSTQHAPPMSIPAPTI